jgi:hypothetical protein
LMSRGGVEEGDRKDTRKHDLARNTDRWTFVWFFA